MPQSTEIARRMGYQTLLSGATDEDSRLGGRPAAFVVVDYEGRSRFDPDQDQHVYEIVAHQHDALGIVRLTDAIAPRVVSLFEHWGVGLPRIGGHGMPPIVRVSAAEADLPEAQRVNLVARRIVEDVFGPRLFVDNPRSLVICVDNFTDDGGAYRHGLVQTQTGALTLDMVFFGHKSSLLLKMHEILHAFGAKDIYGHDGQRNARHSVMSSSPGAGDRSTMLPDPWHRMAMGLTNPDIWDVRGYIEAETSFSVELSVAGGEEGWPAIVLWDQHHGVDEYFVVELRDARQMVDTATASGFVVWLVKVDPSGQPVDIPAAGGGWNTAVLTVGSRGDLELGGWDPWVPPTGQSVVSTPPLRWLDGTHAGFTLNMSLRNPGDFSSGIVTFEPHLEIVQAPRVVLNPIELAEPVVDVDIAITPRPDAPGPVG